MFSFTVILLLGAFAIGVEPHGYLHEPISRTSMFVVYPEMYPTQPPEWNHQGVWCENVPQDLTYSTCGRCGEPFGNNDFSQGGRLGNNIIVANYTAGSVIDVVGKFQAGHYGHFEVELCSQEQETDNCFMRLPIVGGSESVRVDNRICIDCDNCGDSHATVTAKVQLPAGTKCSRCTLRWTYRTSYPGPANWDSCFTDAPAQTFRNCADVAIN